LKLLEYAAATLAAMHRFIFYLLGRLVGKAIAPAVF
jgi:hypothetical protein